MSTVWIVHKEPAQRAVLARWAASGPDSVLGGPGDALFDAAPAPDAVVLGLQGDFEQELEFAHRVTRRTGAAPWILLADRADVDDARRLFDTLPVQVLASPGEGPLLRRHLRAVHRRRAEALSRRRARAAVAGRFSRWFADLDLPDALRALDPRLSEVPLLVRGEPGSGRGLLAAYVHHHGGTGAGHLERIACAGLDADALLAEVARAVALPSAARGLTLCLEEVDLLPGSTQRRLRSWIEGGLPPGLPAPAPLRWAATASDDVLGAGPLEAGLARTLAGLEVRIPPLRERPDAIEPLVASTARAWCASHGERPRRFSGDAVALLREHPWPGNLRELEAVVVRTLAGSDEVTGGSDEVTAGSDEVTAGELRFEGLLPGAAPAPWSAVPGREATPERQAPRLEAPPERQAPRPEALPVVEAEPEPFEEEGTAPVPSAPGPPVAATEAAASPPPLAMAEESLRRLIGAISHEVRNPLVAIRTFSQLLPERFDDPEFRDRFAAIVNEDVRRIEEVVNRLAHFAALDSPERKPVDVTALLETLLESRREEIQARRLVVLRELEREHPEAQGDGGQLRFAFESLIGKALELVPERGDVYLASHFHPEGLEGKPSLRILLRFESPDEIVPTVDVEGISLAETALEIVVAGAIVRAGGGRMSASPTPDRETVIILDLPA